MDNELFIMEVEKQTILYDITHHFYKDNIRKDKAWCLVAGVCGVEVDVCKQRWKSLMDAFVKSRKQSTPSGSAGGTQKGWKYAGLMSFVFPYIQQWSSKSSLGNPSPLEEMEIAGTPGTEEQSRIISGSPKRPSRSRSPQESTPAAAQRSTRRRPQSTDLGEQLMSLLHEPPATPHMPDSELEESYHFALSLVPILQRLDKDRKHQAKIKIVNTLHSLEKDNTQHQQHWQPIDHPPTSQHSSHTSRPVAFRPTVPQPPQAQSTPTGPFTDMAL